MFRTRPNFRRCALLLPLLALLAGCAGSTNSSSSPNTPAAPSNALAAGGASSVYVLQLPPYGTTQSYLLQFAAGANGSVSPSASVALPDQFFPYCVATDSSGNVYVGGVSGNAIQGLVNQVLEFASGLAGSATPIRTITVGSFNVGSVDALAVDAAGAIYATLSAGEILVYAPTANGSVTPTQTISGSLTTLTGTVDYPGLAVDSTGTIYVAGFNASGSWTEIAVFAAGANGNVAPVRTIQTSGYYFYGIALDSSGHLFAVEDPNGTGVPTLAEFAGGASGLATPVKTLTMNLPQDPVTGWGGVHVDKAGNIYLNQTTELTSSFSYEVLAVGPNASGYVTPAASLTSSALSNASAAIAVQ